MWLMKLNFHFKFPFFLVDSMTSERMSHRRRCGLKILLEKISCEPVEIFCEKLPLKIPGSGTAGHCKPWQTVYHFCLLLI